MPTIPPGSIKSPESHVRSDCVQRAQADVALRTVVQTLLESSRAGDGIARFGGEELALTIADVDEPALRAIAERFHVLVRRSRARVGQQDLPVTISVGGTIAEVGGTAEASFEPADAALYRAVEGGQNRVRLAGDAGAAGAAGAVTAWRPRARGSGARNRRDKARPPVEATLASGSSEIRAGFVPRRIASGGGRVPGAGLPASRSRAAPTDPQGVRRCK